MLFFLAVSRLGTRFFWRIANHGLEWTHRHGGALGTAGNNRNRAQRHGGLSQEGVRQDTTAGPDGRLGQARNLANFAQSLTNMGVDDLGTKGELSDILETFEPNQNF